MPAARVWVPVNVNSTSERHSSGCAAASSSATIVPSFSADYGGAIGPRRLQHGDGVVHLGLEVGELIEWHRIGEPRASAVEVDQPTQRAQPSKEPREVGEVPHRLDVMHPRVDQEQVQCAFADHLEGKMHVAVPRILESSAGLPHRRRS